MGRVRSGMGAGHAVRNEEHLQELCKLMADPNASVRQLNTLYAIRTAWASRGYLLDRELLIVRTDSQGEYISRAEKRAGRTHSVPTLTPETPVVEDGVTIESEEKVSPEVTENSERAQVKAFGKRRDK